MEASSVERHGQTRVYWNGGVVDDGLSRLEEGLAARYATLQQQPQQRALGAKKDAPRDRCRALAAIRMRRGVRSPFHFRSFAFAARQAPLPLCRFFVVVWRARRDAHIMTTPASVSSRRPPLTCDSVRVCSSGAVLRMDPQRACAHAVPRMFRHCTLRLFPSLQMGPVAGCARRPSRWC